MSYSDTTFARIQAHLDSLQLQEQDARYELAQPGVQPWIREQLLRLIDRLTSERAVLERALGSRRRDRAVS